MKVVHKRKFVGKKRQFHLTNKNGKMFATRETPSKSTPVCASDGLPVNG